MTRNIIAAAVSVAAAACLAAPATAETTQTLAPGVSLNHFLADGVTGELLSVDLTQKQIRVDLLHPSSVGQRATVTDMVAAQHAIAEISSTSTNHSTPALPPPDRRMARQLPTARHSRRRYRISSASDPRWSPASALAM
jgi:hypothetical protein